MGGGVVSVLATRRSLVWMLVPQKQVTFLVFILQEGRMETPMQVHKYKLRAEVSSHFISSTVYNVRFVNTQAMLLYFPCVQ